MLPQCENRELRQIASVSFESRSLTEFRGRCVPSAYPRFSPTTGDARPATSAVPAPEPRSATSTASPPLRSRVRDRVPTETTRLAVVGTRRRFPFTPVRRDNAGYFTALP